MEDDVKPGQYAAIHSKIMDARKKLKQDYETEDQKLKDELSVVDQVLLEHLEGQGGESLRTPQGLITRVIRERFWTTNWAEIYTIIKEYNAPELLEQRIHQTHIRQFIDDHPEAYPKGLNVERAYGIKVTRPKKPV